MFRQLAIVLVTLVLVCAVEAVQADEPQREFSFTGRATINGEPAPLGTTIEVEVNGKIIGQGQVSGSDGKWIVQIDANLLQEGVCEAVFYVNGQPADRQWNRCAVDIRLELDPEVSDDAQEQSDSSDPDGTEETDDPQTESDTDEPTESDTDEPTESDTDEPTESTSSDPDESTPKVQPRSPRTGTGGLAAEQRNGAWAIAAPLAVGLVVLASMALMIVKRRSA